MFRWFVDWYFFCYWLIIRLDERHDFINKGLLCQKMSGKYIEWVIVRLNSEEICKICDLSKGLLCGIVIWYLGDQMIVPNEDWTSWWWGVLLIKYMDDFRLRLFTDSVTRRLVLWVTLLLEDWATEWLIGLLRSRHLGLLEGEGSCPQNSPCPPPRSVLLPPPPPTKELSGSSITSKFVACRKFFLVLISYTYVWKSLSKSVFHHRIPIVFLSGAVVSFYKLFVSVGSLDHSRQQGA